MKKILITSVALAAFAVAGCANNPVSSTAKMATDTVGAAADAVGSTAGAVGSAMTGEEAMSKDAMATETTEMASDAMATEASEATSNPGTDACFENGGSLVQWTDADGESIDACRTSDGAEISIADYLSYSSAAAPAN